MTFPRPQPSPARNAENRILLLRLQPASHVCREYYKAPSRLLTSAVRAATSLASPAGPSAPAVQLELQGADPQSEADAYYEHYAVTMEDTASVDHYMGAKEKNSGSHDPEAYRLHRKRFAGGAGTYPLVGTPNHIADEMIRMADAGFAGTTISFVNYADELPFFIETVLPLLREAGLRQ